MPVNGRRMSYRDRFRLRNRLLRLTLLYIAIAAAASFAVLFVLNNTASALAAQQPAPTPSATPTPAPTPTPTNPYAYQITGVPQDAKEVYFSHDGKYLIYRNGNSLTVMDTQANRMLKTIDDPAMTWARFIDDRDIVLYLTLQENSVGVNTYDIESGVQAKQTSFTVPANSKIKSAAFSSVKNYLCVNVETGTDSFSDEVYTVDVMKRTARLTLQNMINNMVVLSRTEKVYYTNGKGLLYFGDTAVSDTGEGTLLGRDARDKVYFQTSADRGTVHVVADGKRESTLQLTDIPNLVTFCNTNSGVYAIYDGFIVDLSKDAAAQIPFDKALDFVGIGGQNVFFRNAAGEILGIELLK